MMRAGFVLLSLTVWILAAVPAAAAVIYEFRGTCPAGGFCSGDVTGTVTLKDSYIPGTPLTRNDVDTLETSLYGGPLSGELRGGGVATNGSLPDSLDWMPASVQVEVNKLIPDPGSGVRLIERIWSIWTVAGSGFWEVSLARQGGTIFEQGLQAEWRLVSNTPVTVPLPATGALLGGVLLGGAFAARRRARRRQGDVQ